MTTDNINNGDVFTQYATPNFCFVALNIARDKWGILYASPNTAPLLSPATFTKQQLADYISQNKFSKDGVATIHIV